MPDIALVFKNAQVRQHLKVPKGSCLFLFYLQAVPRLSVSCLVNHRGDECVMLVWKDKKAISQLLSPFIKIILFQLECIQHIMYNILIIITNGRAWKILRGNFLFALASSL